MGADTAKLAVMALLLAVAGAACSSSRTVAAPSVEANKAVVQRLFRAFNEGDLATLKQVLGPQGTFHSATEDRQWADNPSRTLGQVCAMCASLNPRAITIDYMMAEGDLVTVRSTWRGTYTGVMRDVSIADKDMVVRYTNTYRLANGRIVENWAAFDRLQLLEQVGFTVAAPAPARQDR